MFTIDAIGDIGLAGLVFGNQNSFSKKDTYFYSSGRKRFQEVAIFDPLKIAITFKCISIVGCLGGSVC